MILFKQLDFKFDVEPLQKQVQQIRHGYDITWQGIPYWYGGWSILSENGKVDSNLTSALKPKDMNNSYLDNTLLANRTSPLKCIVPTPICEGPLGEIISTLKTQFSIYRARISLLVKQSRLPIHKDSERELWRIHVPIVTNKNCYFEYYPDTQDSMKVFMQAGSSWLVRIDQPHRFVNNSNEDRIHFLTGTTFKL